MHNPVSHTVHNHTFWLSPERCLFWEEGNALIIADIHLGKTGHFRKSGIAVPQNIYKDDLQRLISQLYLFKVDRLIIAGDFTHSAGNKELDLFIKWRKDFSLLHIDLIKGNHDVLDKGWYKDAGISISSHKLATGPLLFIHDMKDLTTLTDEEKQLFVFSGHMHPSITIKGMGKQKLQFPCFYFTKKYCVLPAFSRFTGSYTVKPKKEDDVFAIVDNAVMKIA